jgi:hypothetical protein
MIARKQVLPVKLFEMEGLRLVPVDYRDFKAREISPNTFFDTLMISGIKVSKVESMN